MGNASPTVVLIDDSAEVRALIRTQIRLSGLLTVVADGADGTEAIGLAYRHRPDLVLLDMSMPTMDGMDAISGVLSVSPSTRVVIFTGFEAAGLAEHARELGAVAFIEKSIPVQQLPSELLRALSDDDDTPLPPARLAVITDQRDAVISSDQRFLDEHLERFREVFDEAAIGMAIVTLTGGIVRANRALGEVLLRNQDELLGADYGVLTAGRGDLLDVALADIIEGSVDLVHLEHDVSGATEPRRILVTLAPVRDARRQALYVFLQAQDITAQRAAEDQLRRSEQRFRLLVDTVEDYAIFMLSPDGIISSWNAGAQRTKGYQADEIIGRHFRTFYPPEQQKDRHPEYELERALKDGHYAEEGWRIRKDGSRFWADVLITAVFDDAGEHIGFAKVTRDRTESRRIEEEREQAAEALATANASLEDVNAQLTQAAAEQSQFLAVTAHELRTPATVLGGSADTLARHWDELTDDERAGLLHGMSTSADRLSRLLTDLLTVSRLDADALGLERRATPVSELVNGAIRTAAAAHPGISIQAEAVADVDVLVDPDRAAQAIDNLIGNAVVHGGPPVRLSVTVAGRMAEIRVRDSGEGVGAAMLPGLFDRFSTGDSASGTGLGLFITRELARANGGDAFYEPGTDADPAGAFVMACPLA